MGGKKVKMENDADSEKRKGRREKSEDRAG